MNTLRRTVLALIVLTGLAVPAAQAQAESERPAPTFRSWW